MANKARLNRANQKDDMDRRIDKRIKKKKREKDGIKRKRRDGDELIAIKAQIEKVVERRERIDTPEEIPEAFTTEDFNIDTYGETVMLQFRKEYAEKQFQINRRPSLMTWKMTILFFASECVIHAFNIAVIYWILRAHWSDLESNLTRKPVQYNHIDYEEYMSDAEKELIQLNVTSTTEDPSDKSTPWKYSVDPVAKLLKLHVVFFNLTFSYVIPQAMLSQIIFDFVSADRLVYLTFMWKVLAIAFFTVGWIDTANKTVETENVMNFTWLDHDYSIHKSFSTVAMGMFVCYMIITLFKMAIAYTQYLYRIRFLGYILRILMGDSFVDATHHMLTLFGLLSIVSGLLSYILTVESEHKQQLYKDVVYETDEAGTIYAVVILLILNCILLTLTQMHKHHIQMHKHTLTVEEFRDHFLVFKSIYEKKEEEEKELPFVTSAIRMG